MGKDNRIENGRGRKPNQKLKAYLVMEYLLRNTDETHAVSAENICVYLENKGIDAEVRSIYSDIKEINKALIIRYHKDYTILDAENDIKKRGDKARFVIYDRHLHGYRVNKRPFTFNEVRLAAETIYASKYLSEKESKSFVKLITRFVSGYQARTISHVVLNNDRIKANNNYVFDNISVINSAMSREKHTPEKISFKYLKYTFQNGRPVAAEKKKGERYVVSPYHLLLNDGNYYLLAYDSTKKKMKTYRIDRMKDVRLTGEPREGRKDFQELDVASFARRTFGMFNGEEVQVRLQFPNHLLDTVIERFGMKDNLYGSLDADHFYISTKVAISPQFYGWLCGLGEGVIVLGPPEVREGYRKHLTKIANKHKGE